MSAFYGTIKGSTKNNATRRGFQEIKVSAQSWKGSLITRLYYKDNTLMCELEYNQESATQGDNIYKGSLDNLVNILERAKKWKYLENY